MREFKIRLTSLSIVIACISLTMLSIASIPARADFPERSVKIIVPFAPGGGTDLIARVLADFMTKDLGQPVIIENKPGAGTIVGTAAAASSAPDGYTLVMATFAHAVNPSINSKLPYDTFKAFTPVALVARSFNIVVVNPKLPFKSLADLIAYAKANPGKLNYGSFGIGTSAHLAGELFKNMAHVDLTHVPYKGSAPAITDLLGGQIQMMFTTVASVASYIEGGQLRALAVTSAQRSPAFPNLPTISEAGVPGYAAESWYRALCTGRHAAGRGRTAETASVVKAVRAGTFKKLETHEGLTFSAGTPRDFDRYVRGEAARWHELVRTAHIQAQ